MAALAHLRREEKLGLGIAVALHLALFAALVIEARRDGPAIPPAERMTVSLADEVSLESTAPHPSQDSQAAVAPVLAPQSEPIPAPVTEPVPAPMRTVIEQPAPQPKPAPKPVQKAVVPAKTPAKPEPSPKAAAPAKAPAKPQPAPSQKSGGGSRIGADFLKGVSAGERADAGTPAATFGAAERASLQAAINRQLKPEWKAPEGVDVEKLDTVITWDLNPDGSLKGQPRFVSQTGKTDSNAPQQRRHIEQAIRAVQIAAPFKLPPEFYDQWKRLTWHFDRNLSR
jgi:outer membrane biosynthesis protein TonB